MDKPATGDTLLVGEGDFSFCVAMVTKLPPNKHGTITATSLETEESIHKHQGAVNNIQMLRNKGVTVRLNTDATRLHEDAYFEERKFSRVIFNFPHAGGKSNHKKNRRLLKEFFISATKVLESRGQIFMTLCKGQGGTTADRPRRAWHDSWQVVAMAADADLILTEVFPFHADEYRTYSSTGFRSQDKGFNTTNALTHMFELTQKAEIPQGGGAVPVSIHGEILACPRYIYNKLLAVRSIRDADHHPLYRLHSCFTRFLTTNNEVCDLGILLPITTLQAAVGVLQPEQTCLPRGLLLRSSESTGRLLDISSLDMDGLSPENVIALDDLVDSSPQDLHNYELARYRVAGSQEEVVRIVVDMMQDTSRSTSSDMIQMACCPVFPRQQTFSQESPAFTYQEVVFKCIPCEETQAENVENSQQQTIGIPDQAPQNVGPDLDPNCSHRDLPLDSRMGCFLKNMNREWLKAAVEETAKEVVDFVKVDCNCTEDFDVEVDYSSLESTNEIQTGAKITSMHVGAIFLVNKKCTDGCESGIASSLVAEKVVLGEIFVIFLEKENGIQHHIAITLDIGLVSCIKYGVTDRRLLWSQDYRVLKLFKTMEENSTSDNAHDRKFCRLSLFPLTCVHDMSFWENETVAFDEARYFDVIRDIAGDNVTSVELIDTFADPATRRNSRCYRLTFQSADQALSYDTTWKLQSLIRLEVEKCLKITLR